MENYDPNRSLTRGEFCYVENMSPTKYHDLKNKGLGPEELNVDGMIRITPEARAKWRERMADLAKSEASQLEAERRRELASIAGRAAAASPLHISKRVAHNPRLRGKPAESREVSLK
jgi:hypothetical protein